MSVAPLPPTVPKVQPPHFRIPIFASLLFANVGLLSLAVVSLVALSVREFRADKESYVFDFASQVAEGVAAQVDGALDAEREKLDLLATVLLDPSRPDSVRAEIVDAMFTNFPEVARFEVTSPDGAAPVKIYNRGLLRKIGFDKPEAYDAKRKAEATASTPAALEVRPQILGVDAVGLTLAFVQTGKGIPAGRIVRADVFEKTLTEPFVSPGAAELFLVDPSGRVILHRDLEGVQNGAIDLASSPIMQQARKQKLPASMAYHEGERAYLGASAPVPAGDLTVLSRVPEDEAFAAGNRLVRKSALAAAVLLLVMSLAAGVVARGFAAPLSRMAKATERIAAGDFRISLAENQRNELGDLARSLNRMSAELLERDKKIALAQGALVESEKMAAFGTLGAGIAHEVKNPLTGILGFAELAMRKVKPEDPVTRYLQMIEKETRRCTEIIGNLLKFARREKLELQPVDLNQVAADTYKLVNHPLSIKQVQADLTLSPDLPMVMGNSNQLQQVLLNLAINAGDAMPQGGKFRFETGTRQSSDGTIEVVVKASDNGTGMPPEVKARIFDPFFTTKEPGKGTGLGLSVTIGIVKDHAGTISVDSTPGKGTTFTLAFPTVAAAAARTNGATSAPVAPTGAQ